VSPVRAGKPSWDGETFNREYKMTRCLHAWAVMQAGDTMTSIAAQHKTDWLHIYYANPSLPGSNPSHIDPGYDLRLGEFPCPQYT